MACNEVKDSGAERLIVDAEVISVALKEVAGTHQRHPFIALSERMVLRHARK